ncbi:MAG: OmpA family protein [Proteobacteria bacterium]|nr:OmpA family protein [Pseudomonadota bacterium]MBU1712920.1 OmpA family protein [Pseudomonadota bacterium]
MRARLVLILVALIVISGCAGYDRVVLLPDKNLRSSALVVNSAQGEAVLDQPYKAADVYSTGRIETKELDPEAVNRQFGAALSAQPPRPTSFILYFIEGTNELTPESLPMLEQIKSELKQRAFPEIVIIGHTDSLGSPDYNDALSLSRAEAIRKIVQQAGISALSIDVAGRGSREKLIQTKEGVSEPLNRRVEISVR